MVEVNNQEIRPLKPNFNVSKRVWGLAVTLILLSTLCLVPHTTRAAQNNTLVLKLEAGFDSYFRIDEWVPLLISVSNNGPDIDGELRVTSSGTPGLSANVYSTSIQLPTNSSK